MNDSLINLAFDYGFKSISIKEGNSTLFSAGEEFSQTLPIEFLGQKIGELSLDDGGKNPKDLSQRIAPLLMMHVKANLWNEAVELYKWVQGAKELVPEVTDWVGIYYKSNAIWGEDSTDLILGPFIGEASEHQRIPLDKGLCGLALREERVVNVDNVHTETEHIACSLKTNSELIIPLLNDKGEMIAELDIDCNKLGAFGPEIEEKFSKYASSFRSFSKILK